MLEDHLEIATTRQRLRSGPASVHIDEFADWLHRCGYKPLSILKRLQSLAGWTDWLVETGKSVTDLSEGLEQCKMHVESLPQVRYRFGPNRDSLTAARLFIRFLRDQKLLPQPICPSDPAVIWPVLAEFRSWMHQHRGVTQATIDCYQRVILIDFLETYGSDPRTYTAQALRDFVLRRGSSYGASYAKLGATAIRTFLRFLVATGQCPAGIEYALPAYSSWSVSSVPRFLSQEDVERVIESCAKDADGVRDRAMILLMARLGLRAGDVTKLRFADVNWNDGKICVCGKGQRQEWLPLSQEVGTAILCYLEQSRPKVRIPELFTTVLPPFRRLSRQAVSGIVRSALHRAGIKSKVNGSHVLRHSAATTMLRQGVSLAGIGTVLRHHSPRTTARYAKVDFGLLSEIAQPWPEVSSC